MARKAVEFKDEDRVKVVENEGMVDGVLIIATDPSVRGVERVESVGSENDLFTKRPAIGTVDLAGVRDALKAVELGGLAERVVTSDGIPLSAATSETFAVSSAAFMKNPRSLSESAILLQQLEAAHLAVASRASKPRRFDPNEPLEMRQNIAARAREIAEFLRMEAMTREKRKLDADVARSEAVRTASEQFFRLRSQTNQTQYSPSDHDKLFK